MRKTIKLYKECIQCDQYHWVAKKIKNCQLCNCEFSGKQYTEKEWGIKTDRKEQEEAIKKVNFDPIQQCAKTVGQVLDYYKLNDLQLDHHIQRKAGQWTNKMMSEFISTLVKFGSSVSQLIWWERDDIYMSTDGNQRVSTLVKFFNNEFALGNDIFVNGQEIKTKNFKSDQLCVTLRDRIKNAIIPVVVIPRGYTTDDICWLFVQLQKSKKLKNIEVLSVLPPAKRSFVLDIEQGLERIMQNTCKSKNGISNLYVQDMAFTLGFFASYMSRMAIGQPIKKPTLQVVFKEFHDYGMKQSEKRNELIKESLKIILALYKNHNSDKFTNRTMPKERFTIISGAIIQVLHGGWNLKPAHAGHLENIINQFGEDNPKYMSGNNNNTVSLINELTGNIIEELELVDEDRRIPESIRREVYNRQGGICAITDESIPFEDGEVDHIIEVEDGGTNDIENLQFVSKAAHAKKTTDNVKRRKKEREYVYG